MKMMLCAVVALSLTACNIPNPPEPPDDVIFECPEIPQPVPCPEIPDCNCPPAPECPEVVIPPCPECPSPEVPETGVTVRDEFTNGSLWKPVADHDPNVVVLMEGKYDEQFENCYYYIQGAPREMSCRKWENGQWVPRCFTNPHQGMLRQTWRAAHRCNVIDKVQVTCKLRGTTYIFEKPGADTCSRHQ